MPSSEHRKTATDRRDLDSHREDLVREATALGRRAELRVPGEPEHVVAGFRAGAGGGVSIYFGPDPVYHFDAAGRLRRAFVGGDLYRTQGTTLARLTRFRTPGATELLRHDLERHELLAFLDVARRRLCRLLDELTKDGVAVLEQFPADDHAFCPDLTAAIELIVKQDLRLAPAIKGKR